MAPALRIGAALLAGLLTIESATAAGAQTPAAGAFEEVPLSAPTRRSHLPAYLCFAGGAALMGASFVLTDRANRDYDAYHQAVDPAEIERLYERTVRDDRYAAGALLGAQLCFATAVYLRFLRRPAAARLSLDLAPDRCALSCRF